jgi:hypothetical protein
MLAKFDPKVQEYVQCTTTEGIHDNEIMFAMKLESKRLQSSEVLHGVVMQIKGFNFLQKHKETDFTFAKIKAIKTAPANDTE